MTNQEDTRSDFRKQTDSESICGECNVEMKIIHKEGKRFKYDKNRTRYECPICKNTHRKRTQNEILRDMGKRY
jgi:hypothetical protein